MSLEVEYTKNYMIIKINNPPDNLLTEDILRNLFNMIEDDNTPFIIIRGLSNVFSKGLDLKIDGNIEDEEMFSKLKFVMRVFNRIRLYRGFIYSVLEGPALDEGFELALMSDYIYAARGVEVGVPKIIKGLPALAFFSRLIERLGEAGFYTMIQNKGVIDSELAYKLGLIDELSDNPFDDALNDITELLEYYTGDAIRILKDYIIEKYIHYDVLARNIEERILEKLHLRYPKRS